MTDAVEEAPALDVHSLLANLREAEELNTFYKQRNINLSAGLNRLGQQVNDLRNRLTELDPDWEHVEGLPEGVPTPEAPRARKRAAK